MSNFTFKKVKGASNYLAWKEWQEGDFVVGKFESAGTDKFGNPSYQIELLETNIESLEGKNVFTLNSNGSLNHKMDDVIVGDIIKVTYEGKDVLDNPTSPFNGKPYHKVELEIAKEAPVAPQPSNDLL